MSGLFPFIDGQIVETEDTNVLVDLPMAREYDWDFVNDRFNLRNGKMQIVEGAKAVKVWAYKTLKTPRYRFWAYSWNFGHDLEELIGSDYSKGAIESEVKRYLNEALLVSPYITGIIIKNIEFNGDVLKVDFDMSTIYGEVKMSV